MMKELAKLYWTGQKIFSPNFGIISLTSKGIEVYRKKGLFGGNLREEKALDLKFEDIEHITLNFVGLQKAFNVYLKKDSYEKLLKQQNKLVQSLDLIFNSENKLIFYTRSDSKEEVTAFIEKAKKIMKK